MPEAEVRVVEGMYKRTKGRVLVDPGMSEEWLLRETQMRFVTCIVREHQLWLYGHVARFF